VPLKSTRRFVTVEVTAEGDDPTAQVREALAARDLSETIVRLIIHTTAEKNALLRDAEIHELMRCAFRVAAVVRDVKKETRIRLGASQNIEQMTPLELLGQYLRQARQMTEERAHRLTELAKTVVGPDPP